METPICGRARALNVHAASRVRVAPLAALSEDALVHAARTLVPPRAPVRAGDAVGESLVVLHVEPAPGAALVDETEVELAPAPRTRDAAQVEIAIVLDVSESMGLPWDETHTRLSAALAAIASFLKSPAANVEAISIFEYAKQPRLVAGPAKPREVSMVPAPQPKGRSNTAEAINGALAGLAARTQRDVSQVILLFTDGVGDVAEIVLAAERAGRLHVPIHALVFAPEVDSIFDAVAAASGGSVQKAAHPLTIEFVHQPGG